jgi:hypothetical protein
MLQRAVDAVVHCVRHAPETRNDGRQLARTTGRRITVTPAPAAGCCAPRGRTARHHPSTDVSSADTGNSTVADTTGAATTL